MSVTKQPLNWIAPALLESLLLALHPIPLSAETNQFHVGWRECQDNFRSILLHKHNVKLPG